MNDLQLIKNLKDEIEIDIEKIVKKFNINQFIKFTIITMEDIFNVLYIHEQPYDFSKEIFAEELSFALYKKLEKHKKKIDISQIVNADYVAFLQINEQKLKKLQTLFMIRHMIRDMETYIEKQDYSLVKNDNILKVVHSINNLEHFDKLGYLRNVLENITIGMTAMSDTKTQVTDLLDITTKYDFLNTLTHKVRDEGTYKELITFGFNAISLSGLARFVTDDHQSKLDQMMSKYFANSQINLTDTCIKKGKIRWIDLFNLSIVLQYISYYISATIKEESTSARMANNSKALLMKNELLEEFFLTIFEVFNEEITKEEIKNFLSRFTVNLTNNKKRIDLQFNPIIKIDERSFVLFNTFSLSDIVRAYIDGGDKKHDKKLDDQGSKFENKVLESLKHVFKKEQLFISKKYKDETNQEGEIDLCLVGDQNIYFIECKNPMFPISASTATNNYQYTMKAVKQLKQSEQYFNHDRSTFVKKHLNIDIPDIEEYKLHKIVILSNKNLSGLNIEDIAIRDIYSLEKLIHDGSIKSMIMNHKERKASVEDIISLYENKESFQEKDFINYISNDFIFFKELNKLVEKVEKKAIYKKYVLKSHVYGTLIEHV